MGKLIQLCLGCLGVAVIPVAVAQSAANFDTKVLTPENGHAPKEEKPAMAAPKEAGPAATTPSRYVSPPDLEGYLAAQSSVFLSRARARDPFAQMQDPDAKPVVKKSAAPTTKRVVQSQVTPFSEIVRFIEVNAVMPKEKKFLIKDRQVKVGQILPLRFRGKSIRAEVTDVTSRSISFRNADSGETADRTLEVLPPGMTMGSKGSITAPGMMRDGSDSPIDLEPTEPGLAPPESR